MRHLFAARLVRTAAALLALLSLSACDLPKHVRAMHSHGAQAGSPALNLQGGDTDAFMANPNVRRFYDLSVATLGKNAAVLDVTAYEAASYAIFRDLGVSMGMSGAAMQEHLKAIPRQVVQIVKEDPHVLDSFEAFKVALVGPA